MYKKILLSFFLTIPNVIHTQDTLILRNRIELRVILNIERTGSTITYNYTLENGEKAQQSIWKFWLLCSSRLALTNHRAPTGWRAGSGLEGNLMIISWGSPGDRDIAPNSSLAGFSIEISGIPGITDYYAEGYAPPPSFPEGMAPDSIPGYDDLTPYGPGIVGKTVGPVLPPTPFVALAFLDTLISYKHQAFALGWIKNQGIVQSLDAKLDNAKRQLQRNNTTAARNTLQAFLNEVEALWKDEEHPYGGKQITSEAYALLKFNAEYLVSKL
jgi:hypothetical protein